MTQVIKNPSNGVKTTPIPNDLTKLTAEVKPLKKVETNAPAGESLEDRLHRLNQLFEIQSKYNRLLASKQKLNEFKLVQKTENISLTIEDSSNRNVDFETKNPEVIAEVLECVRQAIDNKIKSIEPLLKW
jgi:predicted DNA-binding protein YlxM (UPF0122 family)